MLETSGEVSNKIVTSLVGKLIKTIECHALHIYLHYLKVILSVGFFSIAAYTVKPLITDPPRSGQPLYSGRLTCPRLILP